jgi:signal transduction histidine kinase
VVVEDNGGGFDIETIPADSTGLTMMRQRLKRVGGSYKLVSAPDSGTRVTITVDLRKRVIS